MEPVGGGEIFLEGGWQDSGGGGGFDPGKGGVGPNEVRAGRYR